MPTRRFLLTSASLTAASALYPTSPLYARRHVRPSDQKPNNRETTVANSSAETPLGPLDTQARWAFIIDITTMTVLLQKASDDLMPPSSLTKMMTAYLVFKALAQNRLRLDQTLMVSEKAWRMQGSKMFVPLGQQIGVEDLIRGMLIQSGNDACIVLAEGLAGSEEHFVVLMNQEAHRIGLSHTEFRNSTGWPDPDHHMSAHDVAMLALHLIQDYPQYYHYFSEKDYKFNSIDQGNRNVLVDKGLADGLKTGHTDAGGFGLCASSERNGRRIIEVLNGLPSSRARAEEGERLLNWAFTNFEDVRLFSKGETVQSVPVWLGTEPLIALVAPADVVLTMPLNWRSQARIHVDFQSPLEAPVEAGQVVGQLIVSGTGLQESRTSLLAATNVRRLTLPGRAIAVLAHAVGGG